MPVAHVIGAGVAGLACAVRLARAGRRVRLHETAGHAGGRCRSFHDETLGRLIDNGNHLLLSGNRSALAYLAEIGAGGELTGPRPAAFPFLDLESGQRWQVRPSAGPLPFWILRRRRRVPGTCAADYAAALKLALAGPEATVADCLGARGAAFERFWRPLATAILNTSAEEGSAALLWRALRETLARGERACRPLIAREGLSRAFVDPALAVLQALGAEARFNRRLRALEFAGDRVGALDFQEEKIPLGPSDAVVLAVPPASAMALVPGVVAPEASRAIVNGHFRLAEARSDVGMLGLVGGVSQWVFVRGDIASVTVSAAEDLVDQPQESIAGRMWREVAKALGLGSRPIPPFRIVKEKRATFAQTPAEAARRAGCRTAWRNLFLAGDWTATGLPATIEGAVRSGYTAAGLAAFSGGT
jgi:squalene-associated FAD-dependent desaturase